jgi:hypothetical protein
MEATQVCTTSIVHQPRPWTPRWEPPRRVKYRGGDDSSRRRSTPRAKGSPPRRSPSRRIIASSAFRPPRRLPPRRLCRCATHMVETDELLIVASSFGFSG